MAALRYITLSPQQIVTFSERGPILNVVYQAIGSCEVWELGLNLEAKLIGVAAPPALPAKTETTAPNPSGT